MINNTKFVCQRNFNRFVLCELKYNTPNMQALLQNPEIYLNNPIRYFKNNFGESSTVALIKVDGVLMVLKRYNVKSILHGIKLWFRKSRAMISWNNAHLLAKLEIPSIEAIAVIENRFGLLRNKAYFIYKYVEGTSLSDYLEQHIAMKDDYSAMVKSTAAIIRKLKSAYITHTDLHHSNMIVANNQPLLLDLDHMKQHFFKWRFRYAHYKDVKRFLIYLEKNQEAIELFKAELAKQREA